jgi:hypothetical protein
LEDLRTRARPTHGVIDHDGDEQRVDEQTTPP